MWHIYTLGYYSAIRKNEIMPSVATWMQPKIIIPSEIRQKEKDKKHMILYEESKYGRNEPVYKTETDSQT